jgi:HTH-type transcriptional regulator/antitoxin HipB
MNAMHPVTTATQIGQTLAGRRKHLSLSQTSVAAKLGISQNRLSELESQPETMTVAQLLGLLQILGLQLVVDEKPANASNPKVEW